MTYLGNAVMEQVPGRPLNRTFDPVTLADDLREIQRIYERLFAALDTATWDRPVRRGPGEWTLHEAIAHLCALNGDGLDSIVHTLQRESYTFRGLDNRYQFNAWNRKGIDDRLSLPPDALCAEFLRVHREAADIAASLQPGQAETPALMPIYNRPVRIIEALSIIMMHAGLIHAAQIAEPADVPPLWMQLSPEIRHRLAGRVLRAWSLLYRHDIGGSLRAVLVVRVDGAGGGEWHLNISPEAATSAEGIAESPSLVLRFRETDDFCLMLTRRFNLPLALITGRLKLRGDLRLFLRMGKLFSVDARP